MNFNFEIQSLLIWTLTMILGALGSSGIDAYSIKINAEITLLYKIIRGSIFLLLCVVVGIGWLIYTSLPLYYIVALGIFELNLWWILFDMWLNKKTLRQVTYISDDGIDDSTSWDDAFFHWLGSKLYRHKGARYSGYLKLEFKIALWIVTSIILIGYNFYG